MAHIHDNVVPSAELLGGASRLLIEHDAMRYELRLTRQGKLLLTKQEPFEGTSASQASNRSQPKPRDQS